MSLFRCLEKPADGLSVILLDPSTFGIHNAQITLSRDISLFSGFSEPLDRLGGILLNTELNTET